MIWRSIKDWNHIEIAELIVNFAFQLLGFQAKLMSTCASKLVFTIELIFLFTYIYMSYSTWQTNLIQVYEYFQWNHVCNRMIDNLICRFELYSLICTHIWETNCLDWDDIRRYWRIDHWDPMTLLNQDSM